MTLSNQWREHRKQTHRDDESERLGDLLAAENEMLRAALLVYADGCDATETAPCGYEGNMCCMTARAALNGEAGA